MLNIIVEGKDSFTTKDEKIYIRLFHELQKQLGVKFTIMTEKDIEQRLQKEEPFSENDIEGFTSIYFIN